MTKELVYSNSDNSTHPPPAGLVPGREGDQIRPVGGGGWPFTHAGTRTDGLEEDSRGLDKVADKPLISVCLSLPWETSQHLNSKK